MDLESLSQSQQQVQAKAMKDGVAVVGSYSSLAPFFVYDRKYSLYYYDSVKNAVGTINDKNQTLWIDVIPPLAGPGGKKAWRLNPFGGNFTRDRGYITVKNKYPEATMRWFDAWFDGKEQGYNMVEGQKGITWIVNAEGRAELKMPAGTDRNEWRGLHVPVIPGWYDKALLPKTINVNHQMLEAQTALYLKVVPKETWPGQFLYPTTEESEYIKRYEKELMTYVQEMMARFIVGDKDIDKEWDIYIKQCQTLKSAELEKIYQSQYNRYTGKK